MKLSILILFLSLVVLIISCSSENSIGITPEDEPIPENEITGKAVYYEFYEPVNNATIFYGNTTLCSDYYFTQLTYTDTLGNYSIENPEIFDYVTIYAFKNVLETIYISPVIKINSNDTLNNIIADDLIVFEQNNESNVIGILIDDEFDELQFNISNNLVFLYLLENMSYIKVDSTYSDSLGNFDFSNLTTSNYCIRPVLSIERSINRTFFFIDGINDINIEVILGIQFP